MNILVVDDEPLIHLSIEKQILACQEDAQVFHAYNGNEMLSLLSETEFLLALVDIKMPGLSGLEAIEAAKKLSPLTKYYIMSGFDEFDYAKQAIRLKVEDYLLKPLDRRTIQNTIEAALEQEVIRRRERKTILRNWLDSALNQRSSSLETFQGYSFFLLLVSADKPVFPQEALPEFFAFCSDYYVSSFYQDQIILLFFSASQEPLRDIQQTLSERSSARLLKDGLTLFASSVVRDPSEVRRDLSLLLERSCLRAAAGIEKFYYLKPLMNYDKSLLDFCRICLDWQSAYREKNYTLFMNQSAHICTLLERQKNLTPYYAQFETFFMYVLQISPDGEDFAAFEPAKFSPSKLQKFFEKGSKSLLQISTSERLIDTIIHFIQEHFCDNLSITALSEQFGLSANYISQLLKQELGVRYNDYVTQLRLNRAKELLISTNQSIKEITSACGYFSQSHFTRLFTEHEQCTPTEYRKRQ